MSDSTDSPVLSASQVDTWTLCQRKWAWSYIEKIKKSNNFATLGTDVHQVLADWLEKGKPIDTTSQIGRIILPGLKHLPPPGTAGLEIEKGFELETEAAKYRGFKDLQYMSSEGIPVVGDHKTTTDFKWAKTEDDLRKNTQSIIYAQDALNRYEAKAVDLRWVYYRTTGSPGSHLVKLRVVQSEVEDQMGLIDETASEILKAYKTFTKATDADPTPTACEAYGGCVYMENCNLSTKERMRAFMAQETLADKLKKRAAEKKTEESTGAPAVQQDTSPASKTGSASLQEKLAARKAQGVNPPPVETAPVASPATNGHDHGADPTQPASATSSADDASAPRKRGRPSKAETEAREAAATGAATTESEPETEPSSPKPNALNPTAEGVLEAISNGWARSQYIEFLLATAYELKRWHGINVEIKIS